MQQTNCVYAHVCSVVVRATKCMPAGLHVHACGKRNRLRRSEKQQQQKNRKYLEIVQNQITMLQRDEIVHKTNSNE